MRRIQLAELESWVARGSESAYISFNGPVRRVVVVHQLELVCQVGEVGEVGEVCCCRQRARALHGGHHVAALVLHSDLRRKNRGERRFPAEWEDVPGLGLRGRDRVWATLGAVGLGQTPRSVALVHRLCASSSPRDSAVSGGRRIRPRRRPRSAFDCVCGC